LSRKLRITIFLFLFVQPAAGSHVDALDLLAPPWSHAGDYPNFVETADFNDDGIDDLAISSQYGQAITLLNVQPRTDANVTRAKVIEVMEAQNAQIRILMEKMGRKRILLTDDQRRILAVMLRVEGMGEGVRGRRLRWHR
jgi:hypothetical protein